MARQLCSEFSVCQLDPSSDARTNIREKLRNFGPSDLPMIKALLTDKSLLNYQSQATVAVGAAESHRSRAASAAAANPRPVSWHHEHQHLRRNGELTVSYVDELGRLSDANVSNGDVSRMNGHADMVLPDGKVNGGQVNGLRQHSLEVVMTTSGKKSVVNHNQSQSDSVTLAGRPVANEC